MGTPAYKWEDFTQACLEDLELLESGRGSKNVYIYGKARNSARDELGLRSDKAILNFVGSIAEADLHDHSCDPLREFHVQKVLDLKPMVDSYSYQDRKTLCYIAIWKNPLTSLFVLKSLKKNRNSSVGQKHFNNALFNGLLSLSKLGGKK